MAKGSITMRVENLQKLLDQVQEIDEKGRKAVKAKVHDVKAKDSGNTILQKSFPGGMLTLTGSNSASALASTPARYIIGDLANDLVFQKMKEKHKDEIKGFGWRAIISSFFGELADSLIFIPIAFLGQLPFEKLVQMLVVQVLLKTAYELIILPVTTLVVKAVDHYERGV